MLPARALCASHQVLRHSVVLSSFLGRAGAAADSGGVLGQAQRAGGRADLPGTPHEFLTLTCMSVMSDHPISLFMTGRSKFNSVCYCHHGYLP